MSKELERLRPDKPLKMDLEVAKEMKLQLMHGLAPNVPAPEFDLLIHKIQKIQSLF